MKNRAGVAGLILAGSAVVLCILSFVYGLVDGLDFALFQHYTETGRFLRISGGILGVVGLVLTVAAYIRKEYNRVYICSGVLSLFAIAWEFVAIAIGIVIIIGIVSAIGA